MSKVSVLASLVALSFSGTVFAQTCASPLDIGSPGAVSGDTSTAENTIAGFGPLPSPHNDIVYSFVAEGANATITVSAASYDYGVVLIQTCAGVSSAPIQASTGPGPGGAFTIATDSLVDGTTYYIVVTGNPSVDTPVAGTFTMDLVDTLPVELQNFSVE